VRRRIELIPPVLAVAIGLWAVGVPSFWRDESVSGMAASMPFGQMWTLLGAIDAVHGLYYLLLRPIAVLSTSETALRLPSVIATAAVAYGLVVIGRRLGAERAGLVGGLVYALLPIVSRYAQEARSYAIVSALAVLATWTLLNALDTRRWSRYAIYAGSLSLLGWLHLYALLLIPAHAVTVLLWNRRELPRWTAAAAVAVAVVVPLAVVASAERQQVAWLQKPGLHDIVDLAAQTGGSWWGVTLLVALAVAGTVVAVRLARPLAMVALPWAVLPIVLSFTISQAQPIYHPRYVLFCVPAFALLAGATFARPMRSWAVMVNRAVPLLAVALLAALTLPAHLLLRQPATRADDLRSVAAWLTAQERPGDAALFVPHRYRLYVGVYSLPYDRLHDLTFAPGHFEPRTPPQFRTVADRFQRIWLVSSGRLLRTDPRYQTLIADKRFRRARSQVFGRVHLTLYSRSGKKRAGGLLDAGL
jgi:mannosyltransferase